MKILVTGSGFIGAHTADAFAAHGHRVTGNDQRSSRAR
jgi:nucleoside-diphosphate-sugar epimerase